MKIKNIINSKNIDDMTPAQKAVLYAYWIGVEKGSKVTSDAYRERLEALYKKLATLRYGKQSINILKELFRDGTWLYCPGYSQDSIESFGDDEV